MTNPNFVGSDEVLLKALEQVLILNVDWQARYVAHADTFRTCKNLLVVATDPDEILSLTILVNNARTCGMGALAVMGYKEAILHEQQAFEAEFAS